METENIFYVLKQHSENNKWAENGPNNTIKR